MRTSCSTCHTESQQLKMKTYSTDFILVVFISLSPLFLKCEAHAASRQFQATVSNPVDNNKLICHDEFMSVYIPKVAFADLPFTIYIQDEHSGYYQAIAIAKLCHYLLEETEAFTILTVASHGCFVRRQKYTTSLTVVIMAFADKDKVKIIRSILLICERKIKEANKNDLAAAPQQFFCNKYGFNITIPDNATVPPLNLDAVWIPSGQNHTCKPAKRSANAITFNFPFTDCGTQSMIADGNITYWINIEVKHPQTGVILHDTPFHLTVRCSFALTQMSQLGIMVQPKKSEYPSTLKNHGTLRTEMRFAKDSSYRSFYSSFDPPTVTELGQPVYVEVFVVKHEDEDLVLLLGDCWATPTEDPYEPQRWNLLDKGCPFTGDSHRTAVLPVSNTELTYPSLHKWFVVKLFSFVKPPTFKNLVYFHCDIEICKGPGCFQPCSSGKLRLRRVTPGLEQRIFYSVISGGPLIFLL